ncbi:MAG: hypothetical protein N2511_05325, partial [Thermodesulfovibrionales bacterium]|nr:hypothetical protein [Thermodesulfovibrionales bacterium]
MKRLVNSFLMFSFLLFLLIGAVHAKMSAYFPIANDPNKQEIAITAATDGTKYLVPLIVIPQPDLWSLYAQFVSMNGTLGTKVTIQENSSLMLFDAKAAFGGKYLYIWTETGPQYTSVRGIFIDTDGTKGTPFTIASGIPSDWNTVTDIAFGGEKFLVAYEKPYTYNNETHTAIYGKLIDLNGNMSNEFKISSLWGGFNLNQIAYNYIHNFFLVVYRDAKDDKRVLARFVSPTDGPIGSEIIICLLYTSP